MSDTDRERAEFAQLENELRELVEEWRDRENEAYGMNWDWPADELEELLDDE